MAFHGEYNYSFEGNSIGNPPINERGAPTAEGIIGFANEELAQTIPRTFLMRIEHTIIPDADLLGQYSIMVKMPLITPNGEIKNPLHEYFPNTDPRSVLIVNYAHNIQPIDTTYFFLKTLAFELDGEAIQVAQTEYARPNQVPDVNNTFIQIQHRHSLDVFRPSYQNNDPTFEMTGQDTLRNMLDPKVDWSALQAHALERRESIRPVAPDFNVVESRVMTNRTRKIIGILHKPQYTSVLKAVREYVNSDK